MEGFSVVTMDKACEYGDIFVTATGNYNVIDGCHMEKMKNNTILCTCVLEYIPCSLYDDNATAATTHPTHTEHPEPAGDRVFRV